MDVGARLRKARLEAKMSQGDVEARTGLLRCYISRVENGFTVPNLITIGKFCAAMDIPLYQLFWEGEGKSVPSKIKSLINIPIHGMELTASFLEVISQLSNEDREKLLRIAIAISPHKLFRQRNQKGKGIK